MMIGRCLMGYGNHMGTAAVAKFIYETCSKDLNGPLGSLTWSMLAAGCATCLVFGLMLPSDPEEMKTDELWRVTYALPGIFAII